jgi:MOSC domain-containing protein
VTGSLQGMSIIADGAVVEQIWRYPVKSLRGERLRACRINERGVAGDRLWAVRDPASGKIGSGKNSRRFRCFPGPALLELASRYPDADAEGNLDEDEPPYVIGTDGRQYSVLDGSADLFIQRFTGVPTLRVSRETDVDHFDDGPVSLLGTATLRWVEENLPGTAVDARRFRPNFVVRTQEPFAEESWVGRTLRFGAKNGLAGGAELAVEMVLPRCVMITTAQADLPHAPEVLKLVGTRADQPVKLAIAAKVARPGAVSVGDRVHLIDGAQA